MKKNWGATLLVLIASIIVCSVAVMAYLHMSYLPNQKRIIALQKKRASVQQQRDIWEQQQLNQYDGSKIQPVNARFNVLYANKINEFEVTGVVLQELQEFMSHTGIDFQTFKELPHKTEPSGIVDYSYSLTAKGSFSEVVELIEWLELEKRAVIDGWNLPPTCYCAQWEVMQNRPRLKCTKHPFQVWWHWVENIPLTYLSQPQLPEVKKITRDLFVEQRPHHKVSRKKIYRLEALLSGKEGLSAMINGKALRPGQYIDRYRVVAVLEDKVLLNGPDGQKTLRLALRK